MTAPHILLQMNHLWIVAVLSAGIPTFSAKAASEDGKPGDVTLAVTAMDVNDRLLDVSFEIRNASEQEVWICDDVLFERAGNCNIRLSEDNRVLTLSRRPEIPPGVVYARRPRSKYVRLGAGDTREESLSLKMPLNRASASTPSGPAPTDVVYASHLALEISYWEGNLPQIVLDRIEKADQTGDNAAEKPLMVKLFGDAASFNYARERLRDRDNEIVIPYTYEPIQGEKVLRTSVDGLRIPCRDKRNRVPDPGFDPDLTSCTEVEIYFTPSPLEYLFPHAVNHSLFNAEEMEYLQSRQTFLVQDTNAVQTFLKQVVKGYRSGGFVHQDSVAEFDCYRGGERLTSFGVYADEIVETENGAQTWYLARTLDLRMLLPGIHNLEQRVQCALNLRDLYHRLRLFNRILARRAGRWPTSGAVVYPAYSVWFDELTSPAPGVRSLMSVFWMSTIKKPHACPGVGKGRSTYAMNPHCEPNSPGDTVLLFETEPGWNQHGGPELFAFDNHDPKGGCVLLNDGTVRFIRTEAELHALRWE